MANEFKIDSPLITIDSRELHYYRITDPVLSTRPVTYQ